MGVFDEGKKRFNQRVTQTQEKIDKGMAQVQERIDKRIAEVRSYWESLIEDLTVLFDQDSFYKEEYGTPEEFIKGEEFEQYALNLFPKKEYDLLNLTHDFETNELRYVEESLYYDFKLRHKKSKFVFTVECKYRSNYYDKKFNWAKNYDQFKRYKKYEKENYPGRYYVMMGLGGVPYDPNELFLAPLSEIEYPGLYPSVLKEYIISKDYFIQFNGKRFYQ
jgi:hypothetical protein